MLSFFDMIRFHVWNIPNIRWILSSRISTELTFLRSLVVTFAGILLTDTYGIEIKLVFMAFREPKNCLMAAAKAAARVDTVTKGPNNPIPQEQGFLGGENWVHDCIQRQNHPILDMISHLPTKTPAILQRADQQRCQSLVVGDKVFDTE